MKIRKRMWRLTHYSHFYIYSIITEHLFCHQPCANHVHTTISCPVKTRPAVAVELSHHSVKK